MVDIFYRIGVVAPLDDADDAVATPEGIAAWWTTDTKGKGEVGEALGFRFGDKGGFDIDVVELDPSGHVRCRVADGPEEWIGTEIDWAFDQHGEYTIVNFTHERSFEFMHHCSTKLTTFLLSVKDLVETGQGHPAPDDLQIGDWH